jgi:hypothetical protein
MLALTLGTPVEGYHKHEAWISIMLLSAFSHGGLEEPKGYGSATVRTLCVPPAGACHSAGPGCKQQEVGHNSSCGTQCCAPRPQQTA